MARRASGESSIYKDAAGRWHGYVSVGRRDDGARDRRHVSGGTRKAVVDKVRELERKRDAGALPAAGAGTTVEQWLEHWLTNIAARTVRPRTLESYQSKVRRVTPVIGAVRLDRLTPERLEALYAQLERDGLAPMSVRHVHRVLSRAFKVAEQRGRLARNPCARVEAPTVERGEVQPLSAAAVRAVLAAAAGQRNAARWSVALALGLRQGEALGLRWEDVDLEAGTLAVRRALQRQAGRGLVLVEPKSRAGRRVIALPTPLVEALRRQRAAQREERLRAGSVWEEHGLVFAQPNGRPIDPGRDYRNWRALLEAAGVPRARLHDARHTAATLLLAQGVPARVAMEILGHSQIALTQNTYQHVDLTLQQEAARRVGVALWGEPG